MPVVSVVRERLNVTNVPETDRPEDYSLCLPSAVVATSGACDKMLMEHEWKLRYSQAHDALHSLRQTLRYRSYLLKFKDRHLTGQGSNTRARATLKGVEAKISTATQRYHTAHAALTSLSPFLNKSGWQTSLRILRAGDIRSMTDMLDGDTEGSCTFSWIWKVHGASRDDDDRNGSLDAMRIEWCKARARANRWTEEVGLLKFRLLYACQAVISGSSALYLLRPLLATSWSPNDLDIYVSESNLQLLLAALAIEGYHEVRTSFARIKHYSRPGFHSVITLMRSRQSIEVIVSTSSSAIFPIYRFHSTLLMNFLTHDSLCCSYPHLTLRGLSLIHPFFAHNTILNRASIDALLKYHCRGFTYLTCYHVHRHLPCFKHLIHKLNDSSSMWVVTKLAPFAPHTRMDTYTRLGIVNARWCLGGELCTTDSFSNFTKSSVQIHLDS